MVFRISFTNRRGRRVLGTIRFIDRARANRALRVILAAKARGGARGVNNPRVVKVRR